MRRGAMGRDDEQDEGDDVQPELASDITSNEDAIAFRPSQSTEKNKIQIQRSAIAKIRTRRTVCENSIHILFCKTTHCGVVHVMYKLLYPSIRVRTAPPASIRVRVRVSVSFSFTV